MSSLSSLSTQITHLKSKYISQLNTYKLKVQSLQSAITHLQSQNKRLTYLLNQCNANKLNHDTIVNSRINQAKLLLKSRQDDLYYKQCQIIKLQDTIQQLKTQSDTDSFKYTTLQKQYTKYHIPYLVFSNVSDLNKTYIVPNELMVEEKAVLLEFNKELETQVEELERVNVELIERTKNYEGVVEELKLQNMQGNDFVGLMERVLEGCEGVGK